MNLAQAHEVQRTAREVNDAAQRLQYAAGDEAVTGAAEDYVAARAAHAAAVADAEDPEGEAPRSESEPEPHSGKGDGPPVAADPR